MRSAAATVLRRPLEVALDAALELPPQWRRRLLTACACLFFLLALHLLWFRDSGFVAVERVSITGLTTSDSGRLREALTTTAEDMSTLHVDRDRLEEVAANFPVVDGLQISADFPHTLRIEVIQHDPAAILQSGRSRVAVSADGTVLRGLPVAGGLPVIELGGALPAERLSSGAPLRAATAAGAAPTQLRRRLTSVRETRDRGLVARIRRGPEVILGDSSLLAAKWAAAARVLADRGSRGATYIDVRLPERPAAGGLPVETLAPVAPAGEGAQSTITPPAESAPPTAEPGTPTAPAAPAPVAPAPGTNSQP